MGLETVTYVRMAAGSETPTESITGVLALVRARRRGREGASGGTLTSESLTIHLDVTTLPDDFEARVGDRVTVEDGTTWVIEEHALETWNTRIRLTTRKEV